MTKKKPTDQIKYPRIHENDRHLIEHMWNDEKLTQSEIARKLNRSQSAISRELKQGNIFDFSNLSKRQIVKLNRTPCIKKLQRL
ncbi:MAG: helix-turn-helix domain-containing protein, partial [Leuconostoc pseudomesenteroides]|uniref:helix-turn-helix domain-containing protein n=1 Tax=Leuconostoc pseudomesenteroides TaxID=33968 RepID=UPI0039E73AB4